ncbi:type II secretion system F family protein [Novibacillus thermophilus]|uniref:Type II secretion system protein GspF domain-containing protein n=1 Tax=Novibacillus thermophilus TaxID=1471761 RepID=A0A1U9K6K3_9BACL|nr:type II secretion system F family protein [Novibacillus thermophilus]AQS55664.1 hypothetical protein B0W44_07565 [Novibacillus thermophilus]
MIEMMFVIVAIGLFLLVFLLVPRDRKNIWKTVARPEGKRNKRNSRLVLPISLLRYVNAGELILEAKKVGWNISMFAPLLLYGSAFAGGLFGFILGSAMATVMGAFIGLSFPWFLLREKQYKHRDYMEQQVEQLITSVASIYSLNQNVAMSLSQASHDVDEPLRSMVERAALDYRSGRPLNDILDEMQQEVEVKGFDTFATVMKIIERSGGDASDVIKNTAHVIQQNRLLRAEMRTELADSRQEHKFLLIVAAVVLLLFRFTQPDFYLSFAGTILGEIVIGGMLLYMAWSVYRVDKITQV